MRCSYIASYFPFPHNDFQDCLSLFILTSAERKLGHVDNQCKKMEAQLSRLFYAQISFQTKTQFM